MITLNNATFSYAESLDGFTLGPIALELRPGRIYGWMGHNGSGKSTLASLLAGHRKLRSGEIHGLPKRVIHFQQKVLSNIFPDLTVGDHLALCQDRARREEILKLFPVLGSSVNKYPDVLSGGQLQRLAFALTLFQDHQLYLFDEVTNHLDPQTVELVGGTLRELLRRDSQKYCVFITHDNSFIRKYCDSVVTFEEGRVTGIAENHVDRAATDLNSANIAKER